ncbi:hypothetical protein [Paraburkholderia caribensis]|nr:hypothetical protein [Paraburkholderia caribensis]
MDLIHWLFSKASTSVVSLVVSLLPVVLTSAVELGQRWYRRRLAKEIREKNLASDQDSLDEAAGAANLADVLGAAYNGLISKASAWWARHLQAFSNYDKHYLQFWQFSSAACAFVVLVFVYVGFVRIGIDPLRDANQIATTELARCETAAVSQAKPKDATAPASCLATADRVRDSIRLAGATLTANYEVGLGIITVLTVIALIGLPHLAYKIGKNRAHPDPVTPKSAFVNRAQLTMIIFIILSPTIAWLSLRSTRSIDVGDVVSSIGAAVISPISFDASRSFSSIKNYLTPQESGEMILLVEHIKSALHIVAVTGAVILLVLLEIIKDCVVKPVIRSGVDDFMSTTYRRRSKNELGEQMLEEALRQRHPASQDKVDGQG